MIFRSTKLFSNFDDTNIRPVNFNCFAFFQQWSLKLMIWFVEIRRKNWRKNSFSFVDFVLIFISKNLKALLNFEFILFINIKSSTYKNDWMKFSELFCFEKFIEICVIHRNKRIRQESNWIKFCDRISHDSKFLNEIFVIN